MLYLPGLISQFNQPKAGEELQPWVEWINNNLTRGDHPIYMALYFAMIVFFTYFYVAITFNPEEVSDNMKKYGGFIPGIRPGRQTAEHLNYILTRITLPGAVFLGATGSEAKWFSPIQPVTKGMSDSQNNRCRLAQRMRPSTCRTAWNR